MSYFYLIIIAMYSTTEENFILHCLVYRVLWDKQTMVIMLFSRLEQWCDLSRKVWVRSVLCFKWLMMTLDEPFASSTWYYYY